MGNQTGKIRRQEQLLILGLDAAGKSSIQSFFKPGKAAEVIDVVC
jgi:hypothetical protein